MSRGLTPAVINGRLAHWSISQVRTFLRCKRAWAADKVFGMRAPSSAGQRRGTDGHAGSEAYYRDGTPHTNEAFLAALPALPARHEALLVEHHLNEPQLFIEGARFEGHADLILSPEHGREYGIPACIDWKYVGSFNYTEDPSNDIQMLAYSYWISRRWPEVREIDVELWYFRAEGSADFKPVRRRIPVERAEACWHDELVPAVREMQALLERLRTEGGDFKSVAPNFADDYAACKKYGGCHLADQCGAKIGRDSISARKNRKTLAAFDSGIKDLK